MRQLGCLCNSSRLNVTLFPPNYLYLYSPCPEKLFNCPTCKGQVNEMLRISKSPLLRRMPCFSEKSFQILWEERKFQEGMVSFHFCL